MIKSVKRNKVYCLLSHLYWALHDSGTRKPNKPPLSRVSFQLTAIKFFHSFLPVLGAVNFTLIVFLKALCFALFHIGCH